eukprot:scaffold170600_cov31-Tisochrysis_lutea.AAC.3
MTRDSPTNTDQGCQRSPRGSSLYPLWEVFKLEDVRVLRLARTSNAVLAIYCLVGSHTSPERLRANRWCFSFSSFPLRLLHFVLLHVHVSLTCGTFVIVRLLGSGSGGRICVAGCTRYKSVTQQYLLSGRSCMCMDNQWTHYALFSRVFTRANDGGGHKA